jgi:hypothetical protein
MEEIPMINRSILIVKPRQPYLDWTRRLDDSFPLISLDEMRTDRTAYLVPEILDKAAEQRTLRKFHKEIFDNELAAWTTDKSEWPKRRGFKTFLEWFDVEFHSAVVDLGKGVVGDVVMQVMQVMP